MLIWGCIDFSGGERALVQDLTAMLSKSNRVLVHTLDYVGFSEEVGDLGYREELRRIEPGDIQQKTVDCLAEIVPCADPYHPVGVVCRELNFNRGAIVDKNGRAHF